MIFCQDFCFGCGMKSRLRSRDADGAGSVRNICHDLASRGSADKAGICSGYSSYSLASLVPPEAPALRTLTEPRSVTSRMEGPWPTLPLKLALEYPLQIPA